jgi:hypothetical protein
MHKKLEFGRMHTNKKMYFYFLNNEILKKNRYI